MSEEQGGSRLEALYAQFRALLDAEDKEGCVTFVLSHLEAGKLDIVELYEELLARGAREHRRANCDDSICIWEEHVRTSIIRTVLECCFPSLMKERRKRHGDKQHGNVLVVCPPEEYHELGARMAADFFTLCGFTVTFVGANTPQEDIVEAVGLLQPVYVGVSVTSPYSFVAARSTIQHLVDVRNRTGAMFRIPVGGDAFRHSPEMVEKLGADMLANSYADICALVGGVH
ncbi:MAG: cobalamin B12-binding domain-containing protein [Dehalococcoidia bacterium]|nr:cobalamin B12-binding domain-containing protein [Dehalococcoidia bacterium]